MNSTNTGRTSIGIGWTTLLIGAWLIISPFVLGFAHTSCGLINNIVCGVAMILLTLGGTMFYLLRASLILMGAWLWASAFILSVPSGLYLWNNLILALITVTVTVGSESPYPPNYRPSRS
jgi:hypothetical protein